jgi:hypothetical protein
MKKIIVHVDKEGGTNISTEGFTGTACQDATKQLEKALGVATKETFTDDYYKQSGVVDRLHTNDNG